MSYIKGHSTTKRRLRGVEDILIANKNFRVKQEFTILVWDGGRGAEGTDGHCGERGKAPSPTYIQGKPEEFLPSALTPRHRCRT